MQTSSTPRSSRVKPLMLRTAADSARCGSSTPLRSPVVPVVYERTAGVSGSGGAREREAESSSNRTAPGGHSPTEMRSAGAAGGRRERCRAVDTMADGSASASRTSRFRAWIAASIGTATRPAAPAA